MPEYPPGGKPRLPLPSEVIANPTAYLPQAGNGQEHGKQAEPKPGQSWEDWLEEKRQKPGGNAEDGYRPDRNRYLPDEERRKQREQDQGHSR